MVADHAARGYSEDRPERAQLRDNQSKSEIELAGIYPELAKRFEQDLGLDMEIEARGACRQRRATNGKSEPVTGAAPNSSSLRLQLRGSPHQIVVADRAIGLGKFATRGGPVGNQKSKLPSLLWVWFIGRVAGDACKA